MGVVCGGLSHTRQASQARGNCTMDGPRAINTRTQKKSAMQPGRRLRRLRIGGQTLAQHKTNEDSDPADGDMWNVCQESGAQVKWCDSLQKDPAIQITLPE